jgi:hypothetical protein
MEQAIGRYPSESILWNKRLCLLMEQAVDWTNIKTEFQRACQHINVKVCQHVHMMIDDYVYQYIR